MKIRTKPATNEYRNGWDRVFDKLIEGTVDMDKDIAMVVDKNMDKLIEPIPPKLREVKGGGIF